MLLNAPSQPYRKRVLLFSKLINKVSSIAPERKVTAAVVAKGSRASKTFPVSFLVEAVAAAAVSLAGSAGEGM